MPKVKKAMRNICNAHQVETYKKEMCVKAMTVLTTVIPDKLDYLDEILQSERWQPDYSLRSVFFRLTNRYTHFSTPI